MKTSILTLVLVCISACGFAADVLKSTDQQSIQGEWIAQSATDNGYKVEEAAGCVYAFKGEKLTIRDKTGKEMKYSFQLDVSSQPKLLVLQPEQPLTNATVCSVAYELNGGTLKTATACPGSRPTEISDKNNQMLII